MTLKEGMKVKVKEVLRYTKERNLLVYEMKKYAGTSQTIESISISRNYPGICIKGFLFDKRDVTPLGLKKVKNKPELFNLENLDV